jgi:hypothetical protein
LPGGIDLQEHVTIIFCKAYVNETVQNLGGSCTNA